MSSSQIIRALIVDDEPPARALIAHLLKEEHDVSVVGQCADGAQAVEAILRHEPDLVFLDVQMPGCDGFEVVSRVGKDRMPGVIFVTAYDRYAVRAFEHHAIDYLLKPFEYDRLHEAVQRARARRGQLNPTILNDQLFAALKELQTLHQESWDRIPVRDGGRTVFVKLPEIDWIEAEGNYISLHVGKNHFLLRQTMNAAAQHFAPRRFIRISRSVLVNLDRVTQCESLFHGDSILTLSDGTRLTMSRTYRENFERFIAQLS